MKRSALTITILAVVLSACHLLDPIRSRRGTTASEARAALTQCGVVPDSIAWSVEADGTFAFGRKSADSPPIPNPKMECVMRWVDENHLKFGIVGWETGPH
ncbi:hypothetical protein [Sphingomonas sp. SAFR-052]|uniref:hypothetical protein n=1 Tax=Sphingomonas sp. SAFR-052 TaxID=3436867 RepID=UPI003F7E2975